MIAKILKLESEHNPLTPLAELPWGERPAARRAGIQQASTVMRKKRIDIVANVHRSVGLTPTSMLVIRRVKPKAAQRPIAIPAALSFSP